MAAPDNTDSHTKLSEQEIFNQGFDTIHKVPATLLLGHHSASNTLKRIQTNADGELVSNGGMPEWDYVARTEPNATTDLWTFKIGGSGGDVVGTRTIVYTDSTKTLISTVTKT